VGQACLLVDEPVSIEEASFVVAHPATEESEQVTVHDIFSEERSVARPYLHKSVPEGVSLTIAPFAEPQTPFVE
jgi:hypothetical protein